MEMDQQEQKGPLPLNLDALVDNTPAAELVVKPSVTVVPDQEPAPFVHGLDRLKDYELEEHIKRKKNLLETSGKKLPDKGAKLRAIIKSYEDEVHRRKVNPRPQVQKVIDVEQKPRQATSSSAVGSMAPLTAAERKKYLVEMKAKKSGGVSVASDPSGLILRKSKRKAEVVLDAQPECDVDAEVAQEKGREEKRKKAPDGEERMMKERRSKKVHSRPAAEFAGPSREVQSFWDKDFDYGAYVREKMVCNPDDVEAGAQNSVPFMTRDVGVNCLRSIMLLMAVDCKYEESVRNGEALLGKVRSLEKELQEIQESKEREVREAKEAMRSECDERISDLKIGHDADLAGKDAVIIRLRDEVASGGEREMALKAEVSEAKGELALSFESGFDRAKEQVAFLHPGVDLSSLDSFKIVVDGALVDEP